MDSSLKIEHCEASDHRPVMCLILAAFPDEDLLPLVEVLLKREPAATSFIAKQDDGLVAYAAVTSCAVEDQLHDVALLGPVAVSPELQQSGVGTALIKGLIEACVAQNVAHMLVLGDPAYYGRFGFRQEKHISTPYELPLEWASAWQGLALRQDVTDLHGKLLVPDAWQREELWV